MSRFVVPQRVGKASGGGGPPPDDPVGRIVKYVPAEIISIYTIILGALSTAEHGISDPTIQKVVGGLIVLFCVGTVFYMRRAPAGPVRQAQMIVSPLAFLAWAYPISSQLLGPWFNGIASIVAQAVVLLLGVIIAPRQES